MLQKKNVYSCIVLIFHAYRHKFENFGHKPKKIYEHLIHQHSHTPTHKTKGKKILQFQPHFWRSQVALYPLSFEIVLSFPTFSSHPRVKPYHHRHQSGTILRQQLHFQKQQT
jgi:hypothetical protein